jgi:hypothetical protein
LLGFPAPFTFSIHHTTNSDCSSIFASIARVLGHGELKTARYGDEKIHEG